MLRLGGGATSSSDTGRVRHLEKATDSLLWAVKAFEESPAAVRSVRLWLCSGGSIACQLHNALPHPAIVDCSRSGADMLPHAHVPPIAVASRVLAKTLGDLTAVKRASPRSVCKPGRSEARSAAVNQLLSLASCLFSVAVMQACVTVSSMLAYAPQVFW